MWVRWAGYLGTGYILTYLFSVSIHGAFGIMGARIVDERFFPGRLCSLASHLHFIGNRDSYAQKGSHGGWMRFKAKWSNRDGRMMRPTRMGTVVGRREFTDDPAFVGRSGR